MNVQSPFGFVTGCHAGDKFMVQATLASMRHYCPQVPICLVVDGDFDVSEFERAYGVIPLRIPNLPSAEMRRLIAGNYRAKLAAMWEGPFEFYVWMDSDAIVWGDFTSQVRTDLDFQIFWSEISIPADAGEIPSWLPHYYFNPKALRQFDPNFEWRGHPYFSAGVYACRRNAISFEQWLNTETWNQQVPDTLFKFGDMGMLNYLVHAMAQRGQMRITMTDLQHIWGHHGKAELIGDCVGSGWDFPKVIRRPRVVHFCGRKPFIFDRKAYSRPFTIARLDYYRRSVSKPAAWVAVLIQDFGILMRKLRKRIWGGVGKVAIQI